MVCEGILDLRLGGKDERGRERAREMRGEEESRVDQKRGRGENLKYI